MDLCPPVAILPRQKSTYTPVRKTETTSVYPDGALRKIPAWMIEPQAAQLELHDPPRLSEQCLKELRRVLDVALSVLDRPATAGAADDGGAA
jgi:hypothetical protein